MTQQRAGFANEPELNTLRSEYIERARGFPISVFFNTTVFDGNFDELQMLSAFFVRHADVVRFASFQLQAETGRGVLGARAQLISNGSVTRKLRQGSCVELQFNVLAAGHHECNRSGILLVVNGRAHDALALAWRLRRDLIAARGRVFKLTLFTHNFMDACAPDGDRLDACVFMAMTQDGPMGMCAFNARRDDFLLRPLATSAGDWQPLRGGPDAAPTFPIKWLKGRPRAAANAQAHKEARIP